MGMHDLSLSTAIVLGIFFFGHLLNRGKLSGYGFDIACTIALGLIVWAYFSKFGYFGIPHYAFH